MPDEKRPVEAPEQNGEGTVAENAQEEKQTKAKKKPTKLADLHAKGGDLNAKVSALEQKLADSEAETARAKDTLMRTAAEYDNYRKRSQKETEAAFAGGLAHAVTELLPVLDVLEAAAAAPTQDEEFKKGVIMTLDKCRAVFDKLGVEEMDCLGKPFDPELHNAILQEENPDMESGCVCKVMQKGYRNKSGKVIRHAMVCVTP